MSGFSDPILDGSGTLATRDVEKSDNFVAGSSGWAIYKNGNAEFNNLTIRGTFNGTDFIINTSGAFFYSGVPALGNLIISIASVAGTDAHGNTYPQGVGVSGGGLNNITLNPAVPQMEINPDTTKYIRGTILGSDGGTFGRIEITSPINSTGLSGFARLVVAGQPSGGGNASVSGVADTYSFAATSDTVNITTAGAVQINPTNAHNNATTAFIAGQLGAGSVNWYRESANQWATDDSVHLGDGNGVFVGSGYDSSAAFATGRINLTDDAFSARITTDSNSRWVVTANGINWWGPGGATAIDTNIQRDAAAVMGVTNAWVKHSETWHSPSYNTNWLTSTTFNGLTGLAGLQYRIDAEDNVWLQGCFKAGGTLPGSAVFTLPAGYRPAVQQVVGPVYRNNGGTVTSGFALVTTGGNVDLFSGANMAIAINNEFTIMGKFPLGNIS